LDAECTPVNFEALAVAVGFALVAVTAIILAGRWWTSFTAKRLFDQVIRATPLKAGRGRRLEDVRNG